MFHSALSCIYFIIVKYVILMHSFVKTYVHVFVWVYTDCACTYMRMHTFPILQTYSVPQKLSMRQKSIREICGSMSESVLTHVLVWLALKTICVLKWKSVKEGIGVCVCVCVCVQICTHHCSWNALTYAIL